MVDPGMDTYIMGYTTGLFDLFSWTLEGFAGEELLERLGHLNCLWKHFT